MQQFADQLGTIDLPEGWASLLADVGPEESAPALPRRPTKAERREAKRVLAQHRRWIGDLVDELNPLGALKRRYDGERGVAAMARQMRHCCGAVFCPPPVDMRIDFGQLLWPPAPDNRPEFGEGE